MLVAELSTVTVVLLDSDFFQRLNSTPLGIFCDYCVMALNSPSVVKLELKSSKLFSGVMRKVTSLSKGNMAEKRARALAMSTLKETSLSTTDKSWALFTFLTGLIPKTTYVNTPRQSSCLPEREFSSKLNNLSCADFHLVCSVASKLSIGHFCSVIPSENSWLIIVRFSVLCRRVASFGRACGLLLLMF